MLYRDYPVFFDETEIKVRFIQWSESLDNVVNERISEAGTDDIEVIRTGKATITVAAQCTDRWAGIFENFTAVGVIKVKTYNATMRSYVTRDMRMVNYTSERAEFSERLESTNGLYYVTFDLVEY